MRHSIKWQVASIFIAVMAGTLLLCWFMNNTFLIKYYLNNKEKVLIDAYDQINLAATEGSITSDEFDIELQKICGIYNIDMIVVDADSKTIKSSVNDSEFLAHQLLDNVFTGNEHMAELLSQTEDYTIQMSMDRRTNINYLEMWGTLDNGNLFLIRTALEGIRDSVKIANRFLAYVGFIAVIMSGIIIFFVTNKITTPIKKLAKISEKMTALDFEAKYTGNDENG